MRFNLPVLVYQEKNCVHNHADEIAQMGKNALIVTGRNSSKKNGSLDDVINALKSKNIKYTVYDGVEENPSVETVPNSEAMTASRNSKLKSNPRL